MNKAEEIKLRYDFEANCRHAGFSTEMNALAKYVDPQVQGMWKEVKERDSK